MQYLFKINKAFAQMASSISFIYIPCFTFVLQIAIAKKNQPS